KAASSSLSVAFRSFCIPSGAVSSSRFVSSEPSKPEEVRLAHIERQFDAVPRESRDKKAFLAAIAVFKERRSRQHVEFINSALKYVKEYGVHKELDTYKALLNIFPKGKMIPQNTFQRIMLHYPQQQNCCVKVLDEMEWHGVQPDKEIHDIVVNAFGEWNFATKKIKRMLFWMPKLKYSNKYIDRRHIEGKNLTAAELSGHALKMMSRDPATTLDFIKLSDGPSSSSSDAHLEDDWIVSAQSVQQRRIIAGLQEGTKITVDGPFRVYIMEHAIQYVKMTSPPLEKSFEEFEKHDMIGREDFSDWFSEWTKDRSGRGRSVQEQKDETVLAMAVFSNNDNQSADKWIRHLQKSSPALEKMMVHLRIDKGDEMFNTEKKDDTENVQQAKTSSIDSS
ncbi:hypothetical protein PENTCL1PPCAC_13819, partial [Pristionchus entomophagus]